MYEPLFCGLPGLSTRGLYGIHAEHCTDPQWLDLTKGRTHAGESGVIGEAPAVEESLEVQEPPPEPFAIPTEPLSLPVDPTRLFGWTPINKPQEAQSAISGWTPINKPQESQTKSSGWSPINEPREGQFACKGWTAINWKPREAILSAVPVSNKRKTEDLQQSGSGNAQSDKPIKRQRRNPKNSVQQGNATDRRLLRRQRQKLYWKRPEADVDLSNFNVADLTPAERAQAKGQELFELVVEGARITRLREGAVGTLTPMQRCKPSGPEDPRDIAKASTACQANSTDLEVALKSLESDVTARVWHRHGMVADDDVGINLASLDLSLFQGEIHVDRENSTGLLYALQEYTHRGLQKGRLVMWTDGSHCIIPGTVTLQGGASVSWKDEISGAWHGLAYSLQYQTAPSPNHCETYAITIALYLAWYFLKPRTNAHPVWHNVAAGSRPVVVVYTDSQSALDKLSHRSHYDDKHEMFGNLVYWSRKLNEIGVDVELRWVKGHYVAGNEMADRLAGHGARVVHNETETYIGPLIGPASPVIAR